MTKKDLSDFSMIELFRIEVEKQTSLLNNGLLEMEQGNKSITLFKELMRAAHSIKGAARMVNVLAIVRIAHAIEDCFIALKNNVDKLLNSDVDILLRSIDLVQSIAKNDESSMLSWDKTNNDIILSMESALADCKNRYANGYTSTSSEIVELPRDLSLTFQESQSENKETITISVERQDRILSLASRSLIEAHSLSAIMPEFWRLKHTHSLLISNLSRLQESLSKPIDKEFLKENIKAVLSDANQFRHKFSDNLANLDGIDRKVSTISDHLHSEIMSSRMRPLSDIVNGLPRLVRDLGKHFGKEIRLKMSGISIPVDRNILEQIDTPLKHLVQNAIDHGIEGTVERKSLNKKEIALLTLDANISNDVLSITLEDDGRGIDIAEIKKNMLAKNITSEEELKQLSQKEVLDFIFYPGFSTLTKVSELSGRGVGLDVVRNAVLNLNGSVQVESQQYHGTRFHIQLPLSVSVINATVVTICNDTYTFPNSNVVNVLYIDFSNLTKKDETYFLDFNGVSIPVIHANSVFNGNLPIEIPQKLSILIFENNYKRFALVVESTLGEQELSVHKLSPDLGKIPGIASGAILKNGTLTLNIDADSYFALIESRIRQDYPNPLCQKESVRLCEIIHVLVVDDSMTVRERQRNILEKFHYRVTTASDGIDALNMMDRQHFDIVVTDIDMPNMDGIRLINTLRIREKYLDMPILIISNREKSFIEKSVLLNEKTLFLTKDQFTRDKFLGNIQRLLPLSIDVGKSQVLV